MTTERSYRYENWLIVMAFLTTGCVFIDRFAPLYLSPLFAKDLHMTQAEVGAVIGFLSVGWGISGWVFGSLSDKYGRRLVIIPAVVLFSLFSVLTGLVQSFVQMTVARLLVGGAAGAALTPTYAIVSEEASQERRGLNLGVMQSSVSLIGLALTPVVITLLGSALGWRWGFALSALPGLVMAAILWRYMREPSTSQTAPPQDRVSVFAVFRYRNIRLSIISGFLFGTMTACAYGFLPLYLTGPAYHLSLPTTGAILGAAGLAGFIANVAVPFLSDRVGRKPALLVCSLCMAGMSWVATVGLPLALMVTIFILLHLGAAGIALVIGVIPTETVPKTVAATAVALPGFALEIVGSFVMPIAAGRIADALHNPAVPLIIGGAAAFIVVFITPFYRETAPAKLAAVARPQPEPAQT
jgi:MFS family permease